MQAARLSSSTCLRLSLPLVLLAMLSPALRADSFCAGSTANPGGSVFVTVSCSETQSITNTNAQAATNSYLTVITAEIGSGAYLFNQTFDAPYSDATVQAAITTAENDLLTGGAASYTGPTLTANSSSTSTSTSTAVLSTVLDAAGTNVSGSTITFGPGVILAGQFGLCAGITPGNDGGFVPFGCTTGTPVIVNAGQTNINVNVNDLYDVTELTTATTDTLTSQTYNLNGTVAGSTSPVPEPSTLALFGTGALGLLGAARRRMLNR